MDGPIVACVPNFSEGVSEACVKAIVSAMRVEGVRLLDWSMDSDHNRSVVTVAGPPAAVVESAVRGAGMAAEADRSDPCRHGVHPRIGAADVIPFVPVSGSRSTGAPLLARQAGAEIWKRHGIPVYFYEAAAARPDRANLEDVRQGQFELLREAARKSRSAAPTWAARAAPDGGRLRSGCAQVFGRLQYLLRFKRRILSKSDCQRGSCFLRGPRRESKLWVCWHMAVLNRR